MTADELIQQLRTLDPDTRILVEGYETGCDDIAELRPVEVFRYADAQEWDGEYQTDPYFQSIDQKPFSAVMIRGRRGHLRPGNTLKPGKRKKYALADLVNQCDPDAPVQQEIRDWENAPAIGLEQLFMDQQIDIREGVLRFAEKVSEQFDVDRIILFGSRARGDYRSQSDADVAVILRGAPGSLVETTIAMSGIAYDVILETDVPIQAHPIWIAEWNEPSQFSNAALVREIQIEGITLWVQQDADS